MMNNESAPMFLPGVGNPNSPPVQSPPVQSPPVQSPPGMMARLENQATSFATSVENDVGSLENNMNYYMQSPPMQSPPVQSPPVQSPPMQSPPAQPQPGMMARLENQATSFATSVENEAGSFANAFKNDINYYMPSMNDPSNMSAAKDVEHKAANPNGFFSCGPSVVTTNSFSKSGSVDESFCLL
jgi:hypothetical protein